MSKQQKSKTNIYAFNPGLLDSDPLKLEQLLNLIILANKLGYTVKAAHDMKSGENPILTEIYSVWFAIENELPIFAHNIPRLIGLTQMKLPSRSMVGH